MMYENRVTVFLDILGFKEIINGTYDDKGNDIEVNINQIAYIHDIIRKLLDADNPSEFSISKQITIFSDCIVISFKEEEQSEIFYTLSDIQDLIINLVFEGIICRGAISFGKLIHTDKTIFGPALNEAYLTESKAALYPRVILNKSIFEIAQNNHASHNSSKDEIESICNIVSIDTDDMYYIDYYAKARSELDDPVYDMPDYIDKLRDIIMNGFEVGKNKPDIQIKYHWMKNKFNKMVSYFIKNSVSIVDPDLKDYYQNLKKID